MGFSLSLFLYDLSGRFRGERGQDHQPDNRPARRPPGQLAWLHVARRGDYEVVCDLISNLADQLPDLSFLLTTTDDPPEHLPESCFHERLPHDQRVRAARFLEFWRPDAAIWITGTLAPSIIHETASRGIPLVLLDTGAAFEMTRTWPMPPILVRKTLRKFDALLSGDEATSLALISAGALRDNVHTTGVLEKDIRALPCNLAEWEAMIDLLSTRPVWLAAGIETEELESVVAAHRQALRRSHRLLLIVVPADPEAGDEFAATLDAMNMDFLRRSDGDEPTREIQVYLADTEGEMGLWYRLAPVTFIGQTLADSSAPGPDPFEAAALGSVVLHGPKTHSHRVAFQRLQRAGASREISHVGELAHALDSLLAPDRAAVMAHAAWQISSAGAEAMEKVVAHLGAIMNRQKGAAK